MSDKQSLRDIIHPTGISSRAIDKAIALGEAPLNHAYHNVDHVRKVVAQLVRILALCDDLGDNEREELLIAACIHDLEHTGAINSHAGELELRSITIAQPHLEPLGVDMVRIKTMILCTDIRHYTPLAKDIYRAHFEGSLMPQDIVPDLEILRHDKLLTRMGVILHEADIAPSVGVSFDAAMAETQALHEEWGADDATPADLVRFLDHVCEHTMTTAQAKQLYNENLQAIYEQAKRLTASSAE